MRRSAYRVTSKACPCGSLGVFYPHVVCTSCWPKLPPATRTQLNDALKALRACSSNISTYRAAADAAVAYIEGLPK